MKFSYNWIKDLIVGKIPKSEKLVELLALHSFEINDLKKVGDDWLIDIDVSPNRMPDCASHFGIAREVAVLTNTKLNEKREKLIEDKNQKAKGFVKVEVKDGKDCPRYTARVITDVKVDSSPRWIQKRLQVCGLRPINNIVDIINYVMLETGQPLHAFDFDKIEANKQGLAQIVVRKAKAGEKIITLDEGNYDLDKDILVIADLRDPLAIAGIKGGKKAEIDNKTKIVVIESANFNQRMIRRASRKLDLKTDASLRFEHGIDPNLTENAIDRVAFLIAEIASGRITQGLVDSYSQRVLPRKIILELNYVRRLLGIKISKNGIIKILKDLGFGVLRTSSIKILVEVPTRRLDVFLPEDLIEEIGRIYGYERIPALFPQTVLIPPKRNLERFWENSVHDSLKEAGFSEVYNYSFISDQQKEILNYQDEELIELENPISSEQRYLRLSLIPNLLKNIKDNLRYFEEIKIFELGRVYKKLKTLEKRMLTGLIVKKGMKGFEEFYQLKGVIDSLLNKLGINNIWYDDYRPTPAESKISIWQQRKCAEIKVGQKEIGFLGEISPSILENLKIPTSIFIFDLNFELISQLAVEEKEFRPISRYPAAIRDLAVLVPQEVRVEEVLNKIETAGGKIIRDVDLFDMYEGEELPQGKKNLAFHIIYQADDRTLKSSEIEETHQKIIKALEESLEWEVRK